MTETRFVLHDGEDEVKTRELHNLLESHNWEGDYNGITIFIGDGPDDLVCVLVGDTIVMTDGRLFIERKKES